MTKNSLCASTKKPAHFGVRNEPKLAYVVKQVGPWSNSIHADARRLMHSLCTEFRTERSINAIAVVLKGEHVRSSGEQAI
jgi:hypothetical protein